MKALLMSVVQALVDRPEAVRVAALEGEKTVAYDLRCHPEDVGKVIGKGGKTVSALRALMSALHQRTNRRVVLEVAE